jgi:hypothetical protein
MWITEALGWFRLGIFFKRLMLSANQTSDLGFPPAFSDRMYTGSPVWMTTANPTAVAFGDR